MSVDSTPLTNLNRRKWQDKLGYVQQNIYLIDDTIRNIVASGIEAGQIQDDRIWDILDQLNLGAFVRCLPDELDTNVGERGVNLSGAKFSGSVSVGRYILNPRFYFLMRQPVRWTSRPRRALSFPSRNWRVGLTIIIVAQTLSTIARCNVVRRFEDGELAWSGTAEDALV